MAMTQINNDRQRAPSYPQALLPSKAAAGWGKAVSDCSGTIAYLRKMAERCRRAAQECRGDEALYLAALANDCEQRLAERVKVAEIVASEAR
jgi:hypothetical protein